MSWIGEIPLPAMRLDVAGRVVDANRLAGKLLDRASTDLFGSSLAELRAASPQLPEPAATIPLADGSVALFTEGGLVKGLQQQVYHLSRLASAGRLVAVVVHEINNALSGILGYAQFLLAQPVAAEARRDLARIHDEALRTARVAQNLLRFSRGGRGERSAVRIEELLARCAELKRRDLALRSIQLELDVDGALPPIEADEALLSQVIINLLTNAQQSITAVREVLTRAFAGRGNHVITFEHGEDALPYLANEQVDLIVSDIHRPGLDGIQLYDQLAKLRPALLRRIIFVTGDALGEETAAFLRRSRAETLRKPLKLDDLARAARRVVERSSGQGELFQAPPPAVDGVAPTAAAPADAPGREEPREAEAT